MLQGRIVKPDEPAWTDKDRLWAIALLAEERATHSPCGHLVEEAFDPANADAYKAAAQRCYVCAEIAKEQARALEQGADPDGLYFGAHKKEEETNEPTQH